MSEKILVTVTPYNWKGSTARAKLSNGKTIKATSTSGEEGALRNLCYRHFGQRDGLLFVCLEPGRWEVSLK